LVVADPGVEFSVNVIGRGFDAVLDGGGVDVSFDPDFLQVIGVAIDPAVWDPEMSGLGVIDLEAGRISGIYFNSFEDRSGDLVLATISWRALAAGESVLQLSEFAANPFASGGERFRALEFGSGRVSTVPLPSALGGLLLALLTAVFRFSRHRSAHSRFS
jgi:hypothetical protein